MYLLRHMRYRSWGSHAEIAAVALLIIGGTCTWPAVAQPSGARPAFEVASVKRGTGCESRPPASGRVYPGRVEIPCVTVRKLMQVAYGTFFGTSLRSRRVEVVGGPSWIDTERYSISAKSPGRSGAPEMLGPMVQALLEERFNAKVHREEGVN